MIEDWSIHEELLLLLFEVCLYKYVSLVRATPSLSLSHSCPHVYIQYIAYIGLYQWVAIRAMSCSSNELVHALRREVRPAPASRLQRIH